MSENKVACDHCHLEFSAEVMIKDNTHYFCCKGCQGVYHLLEDEGMDEFYNRLGEQTLAPPTTSMQTASSFDDETFYEQFVQVDDEGFSHIALIIEGIHCSACVWLNEKMLHQMDGVVEADINFTNHKAHITWQDDIVKLSAIVEMIRAIGYDAFAYDPTLQEQRANKERKDYYMRMAVAIFASMNVMWLAIAQYAGYFSGISKDMVFILNSAEWVLSTPVLFYSGWIFFRGAYYGLKNKIVNMDVLVSTGALLTYLYSIYLTLIVHKEAYFDSVSMIITFVLVGKFLEVISKKQAADTIDSLSRLIPNSVMCMEDNQIISKALNSVKRDDIIVVNAGDRIAIDGVIVEGEGSMDESSITGESVPIYKHTADEVISGTVSIDAQIIYRASNDFAHSTLNTLVQMVEKAMRTKPKIEQMANRLSEHFSVAVLLLAFVTFAIWLGVTHNFEQAFMVGISVVIIACPCALALATPVATLVGMGVANKQGILFKEAAQLETLAQIDTVLLDKTGTLTQGKLSVVQMIWHHEEDNTLQNSEALKVLCSGSKHPVARAIAAAIDVTPSYVQTVQSVPARGVRMQQGDSVYLGGNWKFVQENGVDVAACQSAYTHFYFVKDNQLVATIELEDKLRIGVASAINALKKMGMEVMMLTGDHEQAARQIAAQAGISNIAFELKPQDKEAMVASLQEQGKRILMVGDGINDVLALARADISIAMGEGSDIAMDSSDIILMNDAFKSIVTSVQIGRRTYAFIRQNLFLSLLYNGITIPLAMAGYIIPLIAALSMSFSSLLVVGNSMRIKLAFK